MRLRGWRNLKRTSILWIGPSRKKIFGFPSRYTGASINRLINTRSVRGRSNCLRKGLFPLSANCFCRYSKSKKEEAVGVKRSPSEPNRDRYKLTHE